MVLSKSTPAQTNIKINKRLSSVKSKENKSTKRLKTKKTSSKQPKCKPKPKRSKKINKLLLNNQDEDSCESIKYLAQNATNTSSSAINNKSKVKRNLDAYDFNETNDSFENVQIFNTSNGVKISAPISPSSNSSSSFYTNKINFNNDYLESGDYEDEDNWETNENLKSIVNEDLNQVNFIHKKFSKENIIARNRFYQKKIAYLKSQLFTLKCHQKQQEDQRSSCNVHESIPECTNYFQDYLNETLKLEKESNENLMIIKMWYERQQIEIDRQINVEYLIAKNEFEQKLKDHKKKLINQQIELKKQLEIERDLLDLNYDPNEQQNVFPPVKRKLRCRNNNYDNKPSSNNNNRCSSNLANNCSNIDSNNNNIQFINL